MRSRSAVTAGVARLWFAEWEPHRHARHEVVEKLGGTLPAVPRACGRSPPDGMSGTWPRWRTSAFPAADGYEAAWRFRTRVVDRCSQAVKVKLLHRLEGLHLRQCDPYRGRSSALMRVLGRGDLHPPLHPASTVRRGSNAPKITCLPSCYRTVRFRSGTGFPQARGCPQNRVRRLGGGRWVGMLAGMDEIAMEGMIMRAQMLTGLDARVVTWSISAAYIWGVDPWLWPGSPEPWPLELIAPAGLDFPDCRIRRCGIPESDVTVHMGVRLTTPERTAFDCALRLPRFEAVAALDHFLRQGVSRTALRARIATLPRARQIHRLRESLYLADGGAASPRESWLRLILIEARLPRPRTQIPVHHPGGRTFYLDLGWEEFKLAIEYDGREHHTSQADVRHDESRRSALRALGWRVIPVARDVIPAHAGELVERITEALLERGWSPTPAHLLRVQSHIRALRRPFGLARWVR